MKKYIVWILVLSALVSCESNLEEVPLSFFEESNSFRSAADANSAINGVYDRVKSTYGMTMINLSNLNSDEMKVTEDNAVGNEIHNNLFNSGSGLFNTFYVNSYISIDRANRVIANVPQINMDTKLRDQIVGEAKFLRALAYFNLVRAFGDVPLVTAISNDVVNVSIPRTSIEEVYKQIVNDLKEAEQVLPVRYTAAGQIGRATSGAAKSILAKVYLTTKDWQNAVTKAKEVIDSEVYTLLPDYRDVFLPEKKNGPEHIFSIQYSCLLPEYGSSMAINFSIFFSYPINRGGGNYMATPEFADSYDEGDYRKRVSIIYKKELQDGTVVESRTGPHFDKYWDPTPCGGAQARNNFIVIRYADVLLMYAEALNELNGPAPDAYQAINQVRKRARNGIGNAQPQDLSGLTKEQFRAAILRERGWELCAEGHRRWDLLRTGTYLEKMKSIGVNAEARHLLYPLPISQMDVNTALVQNIGY